MSKSNLAPTHWRRPITRTYDYNYSVGEHYYTPQLNYLDTKRAGRAKTPPSAKSFAERFVENPIYGRSNWLSSSAAAAAATTAEAESSGSANVERGSALIDRYGSLDDLGLSERRQNLESSQQTSSLRQQNTSESKTSTSVSSSGRKLRFVLGDRLLNAAGVNDEALTPKSATSESEDPLDIFLSRRKKALAIQSADAEKVTEDPFKATRSSAAMAAARQRADEMIQELNKEAESSASRFRARLKAKTQEERVSMNEESEFSASRADQIRERAKARLAQLESSYPELAIGSEAVARRAAADENFGNELASSRIGCSSISSKTITITKRTVQSTSE